MVLIQNFWFFGKIIYSILSFASELCGRYVHAIFHRYTYRAVEAPQNVVVVGASFAGWYLARELARSLPTGYRVVLVERNSHFHYTWLFPRVSVVPGHEEKAFVPYVKLPSLAPQGSYIFKHGKVASVNTSAVELESGETIDYAYLAIATGSAPRYPAQLSEGCTKSEGVDFFRTSHEEIQKSNNIVIIGGGAVGVEMALDLKYLHPTKHVTLIHSRDRVLNNFRKILQDKAMKAMTELGVEVYLNNRVIFNATSNAEEVKEINLTSGERIQCDLVITCMGQKPASSIMNSTFSSSVSSSGTVLVKDTLQILDTQHPNIFALGDVAQTEAPKMGRAAFYQSLVVADNIIKLIKGRALRKYKTSLIECSTELTLGLKKSALYIALGPDGLVFDRKGDETMHASQTWRGFDVVPFVDRDYEADMEKANVSKQKSIVN